MSEDKSNPDGGTPAFEVGSTPPVQPTAPPPVAYDWSAPPPPQAAHPPAPQPDALGGLIPTSNPAALWSYYCGIFSLTVCFSPILAPIALFQGRKALRAIQEHPGLAGKAHAWVGIITGAIGLLILLALILVPVIASQRS